MSTEENDETKKIRDRIAGLRAMMRDRIGKYQATIGGDSQYVTSQNHSGSYTPSGFDTPISTDKVRVTTNHNTKDGTIRFSMGTKVPNPKHGTAPEGTQRSHTEVNLSNGTIYPDGSIDIHPKPAWAHTADGSMDEQAVKFILRDHLDSRVKHPDTGKVISVGEHHGLKAQLKENNCGCDDNIMEDKILSGESTKEYTARLLRIIQSGDISSMDRHDRVHGALAYAEHLQSQYPGHAVNVVVRHFLKKGAESNATGLIVTGIDAKGKNLTGYPTGAGGTSTRHRAEVTAELKNITGLHRSRYAYMDPKHVTMLDRLLNGKDLLEMYEQALNEEKQKKPYKGFVKGKNHPEGGLSRKEAHRQGIHAGIETKDEAKRKGGFGKLSGKTQARRKSFCARMCGMKKRNTSAKTANDPKSKINAALRVWGCRCGTNESYETKTSMLNHKISLNEACWKGYTAKGTKMKNGRQVPNCVPISENTMTPLQEAYARAKHAIKEEIVNKSNKGTMTGKERSKRDRIAKTVKGIKSIKGKPDSDKEAKYRYATYLVLRAREGKSSKSEKSNTKSSKKPSKKTKKR